MEVRGDAWGGAVRCRGGAADLHHHASEFAQRLAQQPAEGSFADGHVEHVAPGVPVCHAPWWTLAMSLQEEGGGLCFASE